MVLETSYIDMSKRLSAGKYKIGSKKYDSSEITFSPGRVTSSVTVLIVRGDAVNESSSGFFGGLFGVNSSKWYVVETYGVSAKERSENGGFVTTGTIRKEIGNMIEQEFNTKKDAEKYVDRKLNLDKKL